MADAPAVPAVPDAPEGPDGPAVPEGPDGPDELGVYVHVPFCAARCDYCAFAVVTDRDHLMEAYAAACVTELERAIDSEDLPRATSVFFGGGTPSRLPPDLLAWILDAVPRVAGAEVTVECNPDDVTPELLARYVEAGVTRISLGVQSMAGDVLVALGRAQRPGAARESAAMVAAAGFASWSVDLIAGAAGETDAIWEATLDAVLGLDAPPPHLSVYLLTVEPGTVLAREAARHPDDDVQADRYVRADERLARAGYRWEEISNWGLPGHRCRHNELYWRQGNYRGIGVAAHSHRDGRRWWNLRNPERYVEAIRAGRPVVAGEEVLDPSRRRFERLALALRTRTGVEADAFGPEAALDRLDGLVEPVGDRLVLTMRGRLLANAVTAMLASEP